jgi:hypothetical protein
VSTNKLNNCIYFATACLGHVPTKKVYKTAVEWTLQEIEKHGKDIIKMFLREMSGDNVNSTE